MPMRRASGSTHAPGPATVSPAIRTAPASGRSNPAIMRSSVVLPEPLGPSTARKPPSSEPQVDAVDRAPVAERADEAVGLDRGGRAAAAASRSVRSVTVMRPSILTTPRGLRLA